MFVAILTFKFGVESILEISAWSKVDQLEIKCLEINQKILVLDIPMDDSFAMASQNCFNNLSEEVSGKLLFQYAFLSDKVKEVFTTGWLFHHVDEGVMSFVEVEKSDDSGDGLNLRQKFQLQWNTMAVHLKMKNKIH